MKCDAQIPVGASKESVWQVITDIDHAAENIDGISDVKVLERPSKEGTLVGLKWEETRTMYGKDSTETMWITHEEPYKYYQTRAENCGAIYISRMYIEEKGDENGNKQLYIGMSFKGECETFCSKVMMAALGWMMVGSTRKMMLGDLQNIKDKAESLEVSNK